MKRNNLKARHQAVLPRIRRDASRVARCVTTCCVFLMLPLCIASHAWGQSADWPPETLTPAPVMQGLTLPGGRIVPSTARWNMVWADQIIPSRYSAAQLEFAARHYVGSQKLWAGQAAQFRAFDANFLMLIYHLAAGLNPAKNRDCPDPKTLHDDGFIGVVAPEGYVSEWNTHFLPWLTAKGISEGGARFEDMFQHYDAVDAAVRVWHQDPYWLMNLDNADWRSYLGDVCLSWMQGNENEGCFFDVAVETSCALYNPKRQNPAPGNFDWWAPPHRPAQSSADLADRRAFGDWMNAQYLRYFQGIHRRFHTGATDYLVIPNVDQMVTTVYDPIWLDGDGQGETVDGVMMEGFGNFTGYDMWLTLERCIRRVTGRGKILIAQFSTADAADRLRRTAMYMLVKNENSFINVVSGDVTWFPEYELDLGLMSPLPSDLEELRVQGSGADGVWMRVYEKGMVLVNTGTGSASVDLPGPAVWRRYEPRGGGAVDESGTAVPQQQQWSDPLTRVDIPSSGGVILQKETPSEVTEGASLPRAPRIVSCLPQPVDAGGARLQLDIPMGAGGDWTLELRDLLGRLVRRERLPDLQSGLQETRFPRGSHPAGCYFLRITSGKGTSAVMRLLLR